MKKLLFHFILLLPFTTFSQNYCESLGSSDWEDDSNWSCGHAPACGDSIAINPGHAVQITSQINLEGCPDPILLYVDGTLEFTNGNKLQLPCGSELIITPSGLIHKQGNGGGNSTLLEICDAIVWRAGDGDFYGPYNYGGALPITLLDFWISQDDSGNMIKWSTATETNADFFKISRSIDGSQFTPIAEVQSHQNSTTYKEYEVLDTRPHFGISYYKLEAYDLDGSKSYSEIKSVENLNETEARIYPNPVNSGSELNIEYNKKIEINYCEVVNMAGQTIPSNTKILDQQISISNLKVQGIYIVQVYTNNGVLQHKIVVQ